MADAIHARATTCCVECASRHPVPGPTGVGVPLCRRHIVDALLLKLQAFDGERPRTRGGLLLHRNAQAVNLLEQRRR